MAVYTEGVTTIPAPHDPDVIRLGRPSPWEEAAARAEAGEVAHLADDTGEHRFVVLTEAQYLALEEAAEDAEHRAWQERNREWLLANRERILSGELRGTSLEEIEAELDTADAQ